MEYSGVWEKRSAAVGAMVPPSLVGEIGVIAVIGIVPSAPAVGAIPFELPGIIRSGHAIDQCVAAVLFPVIGILIFQAAGIKAEK